MRLSHFILIQCLLLVIIGGIFYIHKDRVRVAKIPPASIAQWYKPDNKRQVWLHNMFKLRREMQAVQFYADNNDAQHLQKWLDRLSKHYLKIGEMVPEWKKKLNMQAIDTLQTAVAAQRYQDVNQALDDLTTSCKSCHTDYRISTATMYRAPDFASLQISPANSLKDHMQELTQQVNQIKITAEDGRSDLALSSLTDLRKGMKLLGETCATCHKKDSRQYPDAKMQQTLAKLEKSLKTGTLKQQGRNLGTLAVLACARCHGTHRIAYDSRRTLAKGPNWLELIKH